MLADRRGLHEAALRIALLCAEPRVVDIERRTVRAQHLVVRSHVQVDVRMIERGPRAHAIELLDADEDLLDAKVVGEVWHRCRGHARPRSGLEHQRRSVRGTIASALWG